MVTGVDKFKKDMEQSKKLYAWEITDFAKMYDVLSILSVLMMIALQVMLRHCVSTPLREGMISGHKLYYTH